jgi:uncharacterized protein
MTERIARMIEDYRQARASLDFLDCNLWIGRPRHPEFVQSFDLAALRQRMQRYQIRGGVVSHFATIAYGVEAGNAALLEALAGTELWAGMTLVPEMFTDHDHYLADAITRGARLARVFPASHNFALRPWCSGAMLQALAAHRMPLTVWNSEVSWEDVRALCEAYPDLPVIVEGTPRKILYYNRFFYPLLARYPNLYLEMHNLVNYLGIEDIVRRFGAEHLLCGSYMPVYDPNATLMQVTHARISEADKALIARGNLLRLMEGVKLP